jgi:3-oxoacyl-[acyl-carrier-protein] synthase II
MMEPVVITGLGVVSAIGTGRTAFFDALASGRSGVRPHPTRESDGVPLTARVDDFGAREQFDPRVLRRLARLSQMALVAAREALAQACPGGAPWAPERMGVAIGTGLGTLRETMDFMKGYVGGGIEGASPSLFPTSVMNAAAGQVAIELGLRGVNTTMNHRDASAIDALLVAADFLALGRADMILVGGVDELSPPLLHAYRKLSLLTETAMRPYSRGRDGTVVGEGAALLVLERAADAERRGAKVLARVRGAASAGEARARVGWRGSWDGAAETIRAALDGARVRKGEIDYVIGAGNGCDFDAVEARAVGAALGRAAPHGSIYGQTGDFLSAGGMRIAAALYALERQALPGTVGAGEPDPAVPLPGLVREPRAQAVGTVLLPVIAQGGADAAVVLSR